LRCNISRNKKNRKGKTLFIDARKLGTLTDRVHRDLSSVDIAQISDTYHAWKEGKKYEDVAGYCKSVTQGDVRLQGYVLTPGRYVGAAELQEDDEAFEQKVIRLTQELESQFEESNRLSKEIQTKLKSLDYGK
jgi:type I restriction enzyme M protein